MKRTVRLLAFGFWLLAFTATAFAGDVELAWTANTEPGVTYRVYHRLVGETDWRTPIPVTATEYKFVGLTPGTYEFAVQAVLGATVSGLSYKVVKEVKLADPVGLFAK